jgi:hypothetical protein
MPQGLQGEICLGGAGRRAEELAEAMAVALFHLFAD